MIQNSQKADINHLFEKFNMLVKDDVDNYLNIKEKEKDEEEVVVIEKEEIHKSEIV